MTRLQWRTAGESHGPTLIGIVEGVPAGLRLDVERVDAELARRQLGYGRGGRMRIETDRVEILSGWKGGVTIGAPIAFAVKNKDSVIERLPTPTNPRPGHADLAGDLAVLAGLGFLDAVPQLGSVTDPIRRVVRGEDFGVIDTAPRRIIEGQPGTAIFDPLGHAIGRSRRGTAALTAGNHRCA